MAKKKRRKSKKEDEYIASSAYSEKVIQKKRRFPKKNTVLVSLILIVQIVVICFAVFYQPKPQDIIDSYKVTVEPNDNGTLDIDYSFVWTALDTSEDLTWVEIGLANSAFNIVSNSQSDNIKYIRDSSDEYGYSGVRIDFDRAYHGGETLAFSFKVRQTYMLCSDDDEMFYEFIPGWFNATPVKSYEFRWLGTGVSSSNHDVSENGYKVWKGELDCGEYIVMDVCYPKNYFSNATVYDYEPFDSEYTYNSLNVDRSIIRFICVLLICGGGVFQIIMLDSFISYRRGRGFIRGYGYPMHTYGYMNPRYIHARDTHVATHTSGGGYHGGGCACACACACAGGGRAGCSQKDTYGNTNQETDKSI
ncbi:MAG: hypothetical protein NC247_06610 [Ruminococcus flavefaciens]|nr:hypothetical protein [Ruminococcus flavefaciens]